MPIPELPATTAAAGGILLVDDHELVRLGMRALVRSQASVGQPVLAMRESRTLAEALATYAEHQADIAVVVLDLTLPDSDGVDALMAFRHRFPDAPVVVLSGADSPLVARNVLVLGAVAYFAKSGDLGDMLAFVYDCVLHGPRIASARHSRKQPFIADAADLAEAEEIAPPVGPTLSTRQLQILQWLLEGKSNREISDRAALSEGTVKNHVSTLLLSFGVRSRAQLISKLRT